MKAPSLPGAAVAAHEARAPMGVFRQGSRFPGPLWIHFSIRTAPEHQGLERNPKLGWKHWPIPQGGGRAPLREAWADSAWKTEVVPEQKLQNGYHRPNRGHWTRFYFFGLHTVLLANIYKSRTFS